MKRSSCRFGIPGGIVDAGGVIGVACQGEEIV